MLLKQEYRHHAGRVWSCPTKRTKLPAVSESDAQSVNLFMSHVDDRVGYDEDTLPMGSLNADDNIMGEISYCYREYFRSTGVKRTWHL